VNYYFEKFTILDNIIKNFYLFILLVLQYKF